MNQWSTPLHFAAMRGHTEICKLLLDHPDIDPNVTHESLQSNPDNTPLHEAVTHGYFEVCQLFLQHAEIDITAQAYNFDGMAMPIHYAIHQPVRFFQAIIQHPDFDPNITNEFEDPLIHTIISVGKIDHLQALLDHPKTELYMMDDFHNTVVHCAVKRGRYRMCQMLLEHGAPINVRNYRNRTAFSYVRSFKMYKLIKEYGGHK